MSKQKTRESHVYAGDGTTGEIRAFRTRAARALWVANGKDRHEIESTFLTQHERLKAVILSFEIPPPPPPCIDVATVDPGQLLDWIVTVAHTRPADLVEAIDSRMQREAVRRVRAAGQPPREVSLDAVREASDADVWVDLDGTVREGHR